MNDRQHRLGVTDAPRTRVAVLGTGKMGGAIARRLAAAGHELTLWDRTRERAQALGIAPVSDSPGHAVARAEVVISSLTDADAVRSVYLSQDGALGSASGRIFIEMSTAGPEVLGELEPAVVGSGAVLLIVPIMGSPALIAEGKGTLLAGGDRSAVDQVRPILGRLGTIHLVGALGNGPRLKLIANTMLAIAAAGAAELEVAGEAIGLDPDDVFWVLTRVAPGLESRRAGYVGQPQPPLFALRDLRKDVQLAMPVLDRDATLLPMSTLARELVERAAESEPDEDIAALVGLYRRGSVPDR